MCSHGIKMKLVFGLLPLLVILILKERVGYIKMIYLADIMETMVIYLFSSLKQCNDECHGDGHSTQDTCCGEHQVTWGQIELNPPSTCREGEMKVLKY